MASVDQNRLLVKVARLYYEEYLTQQEIGNRLRLSRQKVQRLLSQARNDSIVRIIIEPIMGVHNDLEKALEERYGLREAVIVETNAYEDQSVVAREIGVGAAEYLLRVIRPNDKVVISWGGTIQGMVDALSRYHMREMEGVTVIQGLGTMVDPGRDTHSTDLTRRLARILGGQSKLLPAPGVAGSKEARDAFCEDPHVAEVLDSARRADLVFMGIGSPRPDSLLVREGSIVTWKELELLISRGAVGDINLRYFDQNGNSISSELDDRVVGLTIDEIKGIPHVVGVAGGSAKLQAIRGALKGRMIHVLITDHMTAAKLL